MTYKAENNYLRHFCTFGQSIQPQYSGKIGYMEDNTFYGFSPEKKWKFRKKIETKNSKKNNRNLKKIFKNNENHNLMLAAPEQIPVSQPAVHL